MDSARPPFLALDREAARTAFRRHGVSPRHADRMRRHLLAGRPPEELAARGDPLPKGALERLGASYAWLGSRVLRELEASDGSRKLLLGLCDGESIEAVRLPGAFTPSACISTQVGCAMACRFCASGLEGVRRNLSPWELLEQVALLRRRGPVTRLVLMGAGEPSRNLRALAVALPVLRDEADLGPRNLLVSTVGPAAAIDRLRDLGLKFTLAVSLHTLDPELRGELIPTQRGVEPRDLLAAADRFRARHGRSYQVEYVLLGGVNDSRADARELARALRGRRGHVSLIGWNPVPGMPFAAPSQTAVRAFLEVLHEEGISCSLRRTVGAEAGAACGQLRAGFQARAARSGA